MNFRSESEQFVSRVMFERDQIDNALHRDWQNAETQNRIQNWNEGGFPEGETFRVFDDFRPRSGESVLDVYFRKSMAEVSRLNAALYFLPKLQELKDSHDRYLAESRACYERGQRECSQPSFERHNNAINDLIASLDAIHDGLKPGTEDASQEVSTAIPPVNEMLVGYQEILEELRLPNERKKWLMQANKNYDGPIVSPGRGKKPFADRKKLVQWFNSLESRLVEIDQRRVDETESVSESYLHGKNGAVAPEINGEIKFRRRDKGKSR